MKDSGKPKAKPIPTSSAPTPVAHATQSQRTSQAEAKNSIGLWLLAGIVSMLIGGAILGAAINELMNSASEAASAAMSEDSYAVDTPSGLGPIIAMLVGIGFATAGAFLIQVATIAAGVALGRRATPNI